MSGAGAGTLQASYGAATKATRRRVVGALVSGLVAFAAAVVVLQLLERIPLHPVLILTCLGLGGYLGAALAVSRILKPQEDVALAFYAPYGIRREKFSEHSWPEPGGLLDRFAHTLPSGEVGLVTVRTTPAGEAVAYFLGEEGRRVLEPASVQSPTAG